MPSPTYGRFAVGVSALLTFFTLLASPSYATVAEQRLVSEVNRAGVWVNTAQYTPPIYDMYSTSYVCPTSFDAPESLKPHLTNVRTPCYFKPSAGTDKEAVVVEHDTGRVTEVWGAEWRTNHWYARWGGSWLGTGRLVAPHPYGTQASGLTFLQTVVRWRELKVGRITHPVGLNVPNACPTWRAPAMRTDGYTTNPERCIEYGTKFKLPADVDVSTLHPVARTLARAAKEHYFIVSDQTFDRVIFRFENYKRPWAPWGNGTDATINPYSPLFGRAYPSNGPGNVFYGFPWNRLIEVP